MVNLTLIACCKTKLNTAGMDSFAFKLYTGRLFQAQYTYASKVLAGDGYPFIYILSAEYGLVRPADRIKPYEKTLVKMTAAERREWSVKVHNRFRQEVSLFRESIGNIYVLAGRYYRDPIMHWLPSYGDCQFPVPAGLGIGQQTKWLKEQIEAR